MARNRGGRLYSTQVPKQRIVYCAMRVLVERLGPRLGLIRTLEIVLPPTTTRFSLEDTASSYTAWRDAANYLAAHANVAQMTPIIHVWTTKRKLSWPSSRTGHVLPAQGPRLVSQLCKLSGLSRLFIMLEWPIHWFPPKLLHNIETSGLPNTNSQLRRRGTPHTYSGASSRRRRE